MPNLWFGPAAKDQPLTTGGGAGMLMGYQAVYDKDYFDAIRYAADTGFGYVSFDLNVPRFYVDRLDTHELGRIRKAAESAGVGLAFHAPGDNISLYSDYPAIRDGIREHFSAILSAAEYLGARHVTVHPGIHPSFRAAGNAEDGFIGKYGEYYANVLRENLLYLAERAGDVMLCVENYQFTAFTMQSVGELLGESDRVFLTWDIAKTTSTSIEDFMLRSVHRIREMHAHDVSRDTGRSRQIIGDGCLDFGKYSEIFEKPEVATTIEVRPRECAELSRGRLLDILKQAKQSRSLPGSTPEQFDG